MSLVIWDEEQRIHVHILPSRILYWTHSFAGTAQQARRQQRHPRRDPFRRYSDDSDDDPNSEAHYRVEVFWIQPQGESNSWILSQANVKQWIAALDKYETLKQPAEVQ